MRDALAGKSLLPAREDKWVDHLRASIAYHIRASGDLGNERASAARQISQDALDRRLLQPGSIGLGVLKYLLNIKSRFSKRYGLNPVYRVHLRVPRVAKI